MPGPTSPPVALISVFHKEGLEPLLEALQKKNYRLLSTGGTHRHIAGLGYEVESVEDLTGYPSILGGRVKTLHPKVFGGILGRRDEAGDQAEMTEYQLPAIDVVVVDLYPFEETVAAAASHEEIIEKIDIGGISLIRAAAKNYKHCWIIPSRQHYVEAVAHLRTGGPEEGVRQKFAAEAFHLSSQYDRAIARYLEGENSSLEIMARPREILRYGENPHQEGAYYGKLTEVFEQLHGKALSYNNLLDADAALQLMAEFDQSSLAIMKHNNACGLASRESMLQAWQDALAGDPVSAFGGVIIANREIDEETAQAMHQIFFEIVMAPGYSAEALKVLRQKKNRIILQLRPDFAFPKMQYRSLFDGILAQERDFKTDQISDFEVKTKQIPTAEQEKDLEFASKICKHTKSNTIVLAKNRQLFASGTGQTSRVDALHQAIAKAKNFKFDLDGAVMASDAFFPFPDCVEIAGQAGIKAVVQPGGSIKDQLSIDYCDAHQMAMVFTGTRHFKH